MQFHFFWNWNKSCFSEMLCLIFKEVPLHVAWPWDALYTMSNKFPKSMNYAVFNTIETRCNFLSGFCLPQTNQPTHNTAASTILTCDNGSSSMYINCCLARLGEPASLIETYPKRYLLQGVWSFLRWVITIELADVT